MSWSWIKDNGNGTWFSRSGSLLVVMALIFETNLGRISLQYTGRFHTAYSDIREKWLEDAKNTKRAIGVVQFFGITSAIAGTLVWGYGDLIYGYFNT